MIWHQRNLTLKPRKRGFHLITSEILSQMPEVEGIKVGFLQVFLQHTSASISINENADPDVQVDLETSINRICPENQPFLHTCEGADDMPAHVKSSLIGCQLMVPITDGRLALGTWQGVYLCEHRDHGGSRKIVVTIFGQPWV